MYEVRLTPIFLRSSLLVIVYSVEVIDLHPAAVLSMCGGIHKYIHTERSAVVLKQATVNLSTAQVKSKNGHTFHELAIHFQAERPEPD